MTTLSERAKQLATDEARARRDARQRQRDELRDKIVAELTAATGWDVEVLDTYSETVPIERSDRYGGTRITTEVREWVRVQVDDMVLVSRLGHSGSLGYHWAVERTCGECGGFAPATASEGHRDAVGYGESRPYHRDNEVAGEPEMSSFVKKLGHALRRKVRCQRCFLNHHECPSCGKEY